MKDNGGYTKFYEDWAARNPKKVDKSTKLEEATKLILGETPIGVYSGFADTQSPDFKSGFVFALCNISTNGDIELYKHTTTNGIENFLSGLVSNKSAVKMGKKFNWERDGKNQYKDFLQLFQYIFMSVRKGCQSLAIFKPNLETGFTACRIYINLGNLMINSEPESYFEMVIPNFKFYQTDLPLYITNDSNKEHARTFFMLDEYCTTPLNTPMATPNTNASYPANSLFFETATPIIKDTNLAYQFPRIDEQELSMAFPKIDVTSQLKFKTDDGKIEIAKILKTSVIENRGKDIWITGVVSHNANVTKEEKEYGIEIKLGEFTEMPNFTTKVKSQWFLNMHRFFGAGNKGTKTTIIFGSCGAQFFANNAPLRGFVSAVDVARYRDVDAEFDTIRLDVREDGWSQHYIDKTLDNVLSML